MRSLVLTLLAAFASCSRALPGTPTPTTSAPVALAAPVLLAAPAPTASAVSAPPVQGAVPALGYPWLPTGAPPPSPELSEGDPAQGGKLVDRFAPPAGFVRVDLPAGSFGAWLRGLPLAPPGTPVRSYRGGVILPADHANLAAVVAIDVGDGDLQQCADSVIRLHAEWLFAQGRRDASYRAASGTAMPFARWARGERMVPEGIGFKWTTSGRPDDSHAAYRRWLSGVFAWANTGSLARDTEPVAEGDLHPGDFVVQPGAPGHAVLVLDLARASSDGRRRAVLLGQGYMPAQSFHVLRRGVAQGAWFVVEPGDPALDTPFWAPFPWKTLHRFTGT